MAIDITFVADTSRAIREAEKFGKGLDEVADELEDLGKAGDKATDKIDDSLKDTGKEADKLEQKMSDAFRKAGDSAKKAGDDVGGSTKDGFSKASKVTEEFSDEAKQNLGETFSSFRGDMEDLPQIAQDIFGGVASNLGPLGLAMGVGVAAGIGLAVGKAQELAEKNNEAQQTVADLAAEYSELGGILDQTNIGDRIKEWGREVNEDNWLTFWVDESETNFQRYAKAAEEAHVSTGDAIRGIKGSVEDSEGFLDNTEDAWRKLSEVIKDGTDVTADGIVVQDANARAAQKQRDALDELRGEARNNIDAHKEAIEIYGIEESAIDDTNDAIAEQIELKNELKDATKSAIEADLDLADQTAETKKALEESTSKVMDNSEEGRKNQRVVLDQVEALNEWAQSQVDAGADVDETKAKLDKQRDSLLKMIAPFFSSKKAAKEYVDQVLKTPEKVTTDVAVRTDFAEQQLEGWRKKFRTAVIDVRADTSAAEYSIAMLNGRKIMLHADAVPRPGQRLIVP